jgi:PIN domain nuclease of toxin-antitoxin system
MERIEKPLVYLDTHIVCWLFEGRNRKFSKKAVHAMESGVLSVSLIVDLELQYLYEIGRIREISDKVLSALAEEINLNVAETSLALIIEKARTLNWTRDPFDRLITAEAMAVPDALLVTKDSGKF